MNEISESQFRHVSDKIDKIYTYIFGIDEDEESGMPKKIKQIDKHLEFIDKRVTILEDFVKKVNSYKAAFISVGVVSGFILKLIVDLITHK